jgi:hypothetical protein
MALQNKLEILLYFHVKPGHSKQGVPVETPLTNLQATTCQSVSRGKCGQNRYPTGVTGSINQALDQHIFGSLSLSIRRGDALEVLSRSWLAHLRSWDYLASFLARGPDFRLKVSNRQWRLPPGTSAGREKKLTGLLLFVGTWPHEARRYPLSVAHFFDTCLDYF